MTVNVTLDLSKIENRESLDQDVTEAIGLIMMIIQMADITAQNAEAFFVRTHMYEHARRPMLGTGKDGEPQYITRADVEAHIGLHANVGPNSSDEDFGRHLLALLHDSAVRAWDNQAREGVDA